MELVDAPKTWSVSDAKFTEKEIAFDMADGDALTDVDMLAREPVEEAHEAQGGSNSDIELIAPSTSTNPAQRGIDTELMVQHDAPPSPLHGAPSVPFSALGEVLREKAVKRNGLAVVVPPAQNRWEYKVFQEDDEVAEILEEYDDAGFLEYLVLFSDGSEDVVSVAPAYWSSNTHTSSAFPTVTVNYYARSLLHHYMYPSPLFYLVPLTHSSICNSNALCYLPPPQTLGRVHSRTSSRYHLLPRY